MDTIDLLYSDTHGMGGQSTMGKGKVVLKNMFRMWRHITVISALTSQS